MKSNPARELPGRESRIASILKFNEHHISRLARAIRQAAAVGQRERYQRLAYPIRCKD